MSQGISEKKSKRNTRPFIIALVTIFIWFGIGGGLGPLFGKLSSVQKNNNSSFLPKGAEATKAADAIKGFADKDTFNFPTLVLFEGKATPETFAAINAHMKTVSGLTLSNTTAKISDYLAPGKEITVFPAQDGTHF